VKVVRRMPKGSAHTGRLPRGCVLCEKGAKLVLLLTGVCPRRCFYCPLSTKKRGKDLTYANERMVGTVEEALDEARLMRALGTGITGGDPLSRTDRAVEAVSALKDAFGQRHHIHLYTSTADGGSVRRLAKAGLDEIRFHPPIGRWGQLAGSEFEDALRLSKDLGMDAGMELPAVPGAEKGLRAAITFADSADLDFVNLNELEFSETNWKALRDQGCDTRDDVSSGVAGSEAMARRLLRTDVSVPLHYCSSAFKDAIQLRRRIARRAKNVRRPHELLTDDGTFLLGVVETRTPARVAERLAREFAVPRRLMREDQAKGRLEVAPWVLEEIAPELALGCYLVEEYPTADRLEVERTPLTRR
jgi:pyruvate formate-lyase activating enzyme-like uncharacterized protein